MRAQGEQSMSIGFNERSPDAGGAVAPPDTPAYVLRVKRAPWTWDKIGTGTPSLGPGQMGQMGQIGTKMGPKIRKYARISRKNVKNNVKYSILNIKYLIFNI